jgi:hypothetical protein
MGGAGQIAGMGNEKSIRSFIGAILRRKVVVRTRLSQFSCYFTFPVSK